MDNPKIRFRKKSGEPYSDWQGIRLNEIASRVTRKNTNNETDLPLTIASIEGLVDQRTYFGKTVASRDMSGYFLLHKGEYAYNKSYSAGYDYGSIKRLEKYDKGALSTLYICFALNEEVDSDFYNCYFNSLNWYSEMPEICAEGARNHGLLNVSASDFFNISLTVPSDAEEQKKITEFLQVVDNLITSSEKEAAKLQELKRGCLQKMFPREGESVPEVRFPGFTDAWEQRKLLDLLVQPVSDGPHETPDLVDDGIPFISVDAIVDNKIDFDRKRGYITEEYDLECRKKYSPQRDDVYLVKSGATVGKVAIVETDERFNIWSPLAAMRTNKDLMLPKYLYFYLQLKDVQDEIYEKSIGGTQPNLSMRVLEKFDIKVPDIDEQSKIVLALENLDNLITLHQRECEKYKKLKKGLLQKMFI